MVIDQGPGAEVAVLDGCAFGFWQPPAGWTPDRWSVAAGFDPTAGWTAPRDPFRVRDEVVPAAWTTPADPPRPLWYRGRRRAPQEGAGGLFFFILAAIPTVGFAVGLVMTGVL